MKRQVIQITSAGFLRIAVNRISSVFRQIGLLLLTLIPVAAAPADFDGTFGVNGRVFTQIAKSGRGVLLSIVAQPDGKTVAVGYYTTGGIFSESDIVVVRYNADGSLDSSFGSGGISINDSCEGYDQATDGLVQPDGKIVVVGACQTTNTSGIKFAVLRYNANGSPDSSFGTNGKVLTTVHHIANAARAVALQSDGKILVAGTTSIGEGGKFAVVRYTSNGTLDSSFDGDGKLVDGVEGDAHAYGITVQPDGKILVAGYTSINEDYQPNFYAVVRYHANGSRDKSFGTNGKVIRTFNNGNDQATEVLVQPDGKILLGGYATGNSSPNDLKKDFAAVRLLPDGSPDPTFGTGGKTIVPFSGQYNEVESVLLQPNGKIVLAGSGSISSSSWLSIVARLQPDGSLDSTFGDGGKLLIPDDRITAATLQPNGRIIIAGRDFNLWRLLGQNTVTDFDGDGKTDISIFRPSNGQWWLNRSTDGVYAATFGVSSDKLAPGDFTGDSRTDIAVFRPVSGEWLILRSEDGSYYAFPFGTNGDVPAPADYDADGKTDAAVFRPSETNWYIRRSSDGGTTIQQFGANGDAPAVADYDGDGKSDIAIWRTSVGQWWMQKSSTGSVIAFQFGSSTDKPVQGDYTGDGKSDVAVWRPSTGEWLILRSEDQSYYSFPFGTNGDIPASGDYDGDGRFDATVFRPTDSTWYVQRSTAGTLIQNFGISGDKPVPNAFVP